MAGELNVGIYHEYEHSDYLRQTPGGSGTWGNIEFHVNRTEIPCDLFIMLNRNMKPVRLPNNPEVWCILQEPPISNFPWMFDGHRVFDRVFGPVSFRTGRNERYTRTHGALPWHIDKSYDELKGLPVPDKTNTLSCITSNKTIFPGHRDRMDFIARLQKSDIEIDLYGRGFNPIDDKFDALYPYKYSLVIENYSGADYWTEKIADCFLSWTMPIYYGCTNISDYFPEGSFIELNIMDKNIINKIKTVLKEDPYHRAIDAIAESRNRILNDYQLFPYIANRVKKISPGPARNKQRLLKPYRTTVEYRLKKRLGFSCQ